MCRYLLPCAKAKKFRGPVRSSSVCGAGDAWAHSFGRRKGVCRSRSPLHGRRSCMLLCILGALYLANAAQKGQSGAGHNRQSHRVASSCIGNLGGIPAAIETERSLQLRSAGKNKMVRISRALAFGGAITLTAGILAKHFGPVFGGLFLACPVIFSASATLVAKHETQKKQNAGFATSSRGP